MINFSVDSLKAIQWARSARVGYNIHSLLYNHLQASDKIKKQALSTEIYTGYFLFAVLRFFLRQRVMSQEHKAANGRILF